MIPVTRALVFGLVTALLTTLLTSGGCRRRPKAPPAPDAGNKSRAAPVRIIYPAAPGSFVKVVAKAARSLVHVYTTLPVRDGPADWFPRSTLPPSPGTEEWTARIQRALGSGFIVDTAGHILTNAHVVGEKRPVWVRLADGTKLEARTVGRDDRTDLAVLRVTPPPNTKLVPLRLGHSKQLKVGEWVIALGNPFGLGHRLSAGVISALPQHETQQGVWGYLQTDATIDPGNSGGPLLNTIGEVVGLNIALREDSRTGGGFALPADTIRRLLTPLKRDGKLVRSWLGMYIDRVPPAMAKRLKLARPGGALITRVFPAGPADRSGLRQGDVVLSFDGHDVVQATQLPWLAAAAGVGREVSVTVWRDGKRLTFSPKTQRMPQ